MSATVSLYAFATILAFVHCNVQHELVSMNQVKNTEAPFKACIDDSDCNSQGNGYACFQYICYPWEDDSAVSKEDRKATCKSNEQCGSDLVCFRHHDRRNIHKGLCMEPIVDCSENGDSDCKHGKGSNHVISMNVILYIFNHRIRPVNHIFFFQKLLQILKSTSENT